MVEYSPGYFADHWCDRGHVLYVLEGELDTELRDGMNQAHGGDELSGLGFRRRCAPVVDDDGREAVHRGLRVSRHREKRSGEAIQSIRYAALDGFAALRGEQ